MVSDPKLFGGEQTAPTPVRCRNCSEVLGEVVAHRDGVQLTFGSVAIQGGAKLRCLSCGYVTKWHPSSALPVDPPKPTE